MEKLGDAFYMAICVAFIVSSIMFAIHFGGFAYVLFAILGGAFTTLLVDIVRESRSY